MARISTLIVSILLASMMIVVLVAWYASISTQYDNVQYQDNISGMDRFDDINSITTNLSGQLQNQTPNTAGANPGFNIPGTLLSTAWSALRVTWHSMSTFNAIINSGFSNIPAGDAESAQVIHRIQATIALIAFVIFLFILVAVISNRGEL